MQERIHFIAVDNSKQWEVYVSMFPIHLSPNRSPTYEESLYYLKEEVSQLLEAIKYKEKQLLEGIVSTTELWATEVAIINNSYIIKHRLLKCVKCKVRWKIYNDWGYAKDKWYYLKELPTEWEQSIDAGITSYRKLFLTKQNDEVIKKQISKLIKI